ncbi:hypothetical protein HBH95_097040 [Parastagonospora nodorum]|nr:hypothetical protein HBH95_097040 [Parastagonospora nodorum]
MKPVVQPPCQISRFKVLTHFFVSMLNMFKHLFSGAMPAVGLAAYINTLHKQNRTRFNGFDQKLDSLHGLAERKIVMLQAVKDTKGTSNETTMEDTSLNDASERIQEQTSNLLEFVHSCASADSDSNR